MEPPNKKSKAENELEKTIDDYINNLRKCQNLRAILDDELNRPLPMIKLYIGQVADKKMISKAILVLNENLPLKNLSHLKRVRNRDVILCPSNYLDGKTSIQDYLEINVPEIKDIFNYFKEIELPSTAPVLKKQLLAYWSFNFHPNKNLERLTSKEFFNSKEMIYHLTYMEVCFEVARYYLSKQEDFTISDFLNYNATVVVDPKIQSIVAIGFQNNEHPMQHAAMLAIDNVAKTQFGGAWGESSEALTACHFKGIDEELLKYLTFACPSVRFGARTYQKKDDVQQNCSDTAENQNTEKGPYLCTDYSVYMLKEPCIMCSMALVHARAKRIFYSFDNVSSGGLNSRVKLQNVAALNHHFEYVFTGFLD